MKNKTLSLATALLLLAAGVPALANDESPDEATHEIVIHQEHGEACEGDCPEMQHRIFISEDGETTELHGDHMKWIQMEGAHEGSWNGKRGYLGIQFNELTPELRAHFGVPEDVGVLLSKVLADSPAERAGLQVGDILTRVDEEEITSGRDLRRVIGHAQDATPVNLEVWRSQRVQTLPATLEVREQKTRMHAMPLHAGGEGMHRVIQIDCGDEGGDCSIAHDGDPIHLELREHCGDSGECEVQVRCEDEGCSCTVNGETVDCPEELGH